MIIRLIKFKLEGWETRETTRENVLQPPFLRCQQMGVILQLLLIKAIVYGVGIQQRHTQCVCFDSERSPLGMGKDMRNGRGLCLPLMINKGTLASAANEAVCTTWKVLRGRRRDDAAPRLCHTACPLTSLLCARSSPSFLICVACDHFDSADLVHGDGCWAGSPGNYV